MADLSLFDLSGKVAVVTGAAVGIGQACATALAMAGASVAVLDRNEPAGTRTANDLKRFKTETLFVHCDVTDASAVHNALAHVTDILGRLDIAVNNAGTYGAGDDLEQTRSEWDRVLSLNLTSVWECARAEALVMTSQQPIEGKIINIASMWGSRVGANGSYCSSKAAVVHLTRTLAVEWGNYNINVNSISPSFVMTPLILRDLPSPSAFRQRVREITPLGHVQRPEDLYGAVMFLASRASDYITGHDLLVDGGHTLATWYEPLKRTMPPRVSPEEEVAQLKLDLGLLGVPLPRDL